ncbi:MAG: DUF5777 family beta-barrel protein, partial [Acidobacteria bacterium]|nr:DUF5777 family beta-barrel protein [Acidobacteriota bacterium]
RLLTVTVGAVLAMASGASAQAVKASQFIALESNRMVESRTLEFYLTHRADGLLGEEGPNLNNLFGFDTLVWVGYGLVWGLKDFWTLGAYRAVANKNFEVWTRFGWTPTEGPFTTHLAVRGSVNFSTDRDFNRRVDGKVRPAVQVVAGADLGRLSLTVAPSFVANPAPFPTDEDHTFAIGLGAAFRITEDISLVGEVTPIVSGFRVRDDQGRSHTSWGVGVQKEIGGHVFTLLITNQVWSTLDRYLPGTTTSKPRLGFNLIRRFAL